MFAPILRKLDMINVFHTLIARFLQIPEGQVERTIGLLNERRYHTFYKSLPERGDRED